MCHKVKQRNDMGGHYTRYLEIRLTLWFRGQSRADGNHVCQRIYILRLR